MKHEIFRCDGCDIHHSVEFSFTEQNTSLPFRKILRLSHPRELLGNVYHTHTHTPPHTPHTPTNTHTPTHPHTDTHTHTPTHTHTHTPTPLSHTPPPLSHTDTPLTQPTVPMGDSES